ncbi:MAG: MFS transporter [Bacilli bacterium]|nr:MFS transporter [Bacilli bacterium]
MIPRREKIFYGMGDLSANIMFGAISFFLLYFMMNVAGLNEVYTGFVFVIAKGWDAITDYLMGRISDKTKSKYGKRRVYMLFGAIPFGVAFMLLWLTPDVSDQIAKFIYFTFAYVLFCTTWTIVYVPYTALTANMTQDYDERTSLNTVRIIMANIGLLMGAALFALLADGPESIFYKLFGSYQKAYAMSGFVFGLAAIIIMWLCARNIKERVDHSEENKAGFFRTLKEFFKLKEFRNTTLYYLMSMIGFDVIMAVFIFLVNDSLGFGGGDDSMLFVALPLVVAISSAIVWEKLSNRFSKHQVYAGACVYISVVLIACIFIPAQSYLALLIVCALVGFGMSAIQILPWASLPDVVEIDEYHNGVRREGAYYGIISFLYKVASGISIAIVTWVLGAVGYNEGAATQTETAKMAIRLVIGILPGIIFLLSIIFAYRAKINRKEFNRVKEELMLRKQNK